MFRFDVSSRPQRVRLALLSSLAVCALLMGMFLTIGPGRAGAQDVSMADHPVVGSWILTADGEPSLIAFTADGVVVDVEADRSPGLGAWTVTGPDTASATVAIQTITPEFGFEGMIIVRANVTANADGTSLTVDYTITGVMTDGMAMFDETGSGAAIPFPIESMDATGQPLAGYPAVTSEATPTS